MRIEAWWYVRSLFSLLFQLSNISFVWWTLVQIFARAVHFGSLGNFSKKRIDAISHKPGFVLVRDRGLRFLVYPTFKDIYVAKLLYERPVSMVVLRFKPSTFIDVGAHIGTYAIRFGVRKAKVLALEPDYRSYALLRENIALNHVEQNVDARNFAAYSRRRRLSFFVRRYPIISSIYGSGDYLEHRQVEAYPLDDLADNFREVDLMLIDVEGSEVEVLKGAKKTLKKTHRLVIEVSDRNMRKTAEILRGFGFDLAEITRGWGFKYFLCTRSVDRIH